MAEDRMALLEMLRKATADGDTDFLREGVRVLAQAVMEAEVSELTGLAKGERDPDRRLTHRNGYRDRRWDTRVGTIDLAVPRVRDGSYLPEPARPAPAHGAGPARGRPGGVRRGHEHAPGGRPRPGARDRGDQPQRGVPDVRPARRRGPRVPLPAARRDRTYPYLWLDATYLRVREGGHVVSMAALVAVGVAANGERRILGLELSAGNDEGSAWPRFIRSLVERGLHGRPPGHQRQPRRASSRPSASSSSGSSWQRCRVHLTRNAQELVPRSARSMVASAIRLVFEQPNERRGPPPARRRHRHRRRPASPRSPSCSPTPSPTCSPTSRSPRPTAARSAAPTRSSGSTRRSSAGPGSSGSSRRGPVRHPPGRDDPRRAGRRVAGRPALLPARDHGGSSTPTRIGGGDSRPCCSRAE